MERGEVDGFPALMWSTLNHTKPEWLTNHKINILGQLALARHPLLPDVPLVIDYAKSDADRQALALAFAPFAAARLLHNPPLPQMCARICAAPLMPVCKMQALRPI